MSEIVVTDTTCLIALDRIGWLGVLPALFTVVAPHAVVAEFGRRPEWLVVRVASDARRVADLQRRLDRGEAEAIVLALETPGGTLLIDEARGRRVAEQLGLHVLGTAGMLLKAKQSGHVDAVRPLLDALRDLHAFRLSDALYEEVVRAAGEA